MAVVLKAGGRFLNRKSDSQSYQCYDMRANDVEGKDETEQPVTMTKSLDVNIPNQPGPRHHRSTFSQRPFAAHRTRRLWGV